MKLNKFWISILFCTLVSSACQKDDELNTTSIAEYLETHGVVDYQETDSGLIYVIGEQGEGASLVDGDSVRVHFDGLYTNNNLFSSSYGGLPLTFQLGNNLMLEGFEEGIKLLNVGGYARLYIPNNLAYGKSGGSNGFGADEDVIFDVEVLNPLLSIDEYLSGNEIEDFQRTDSGLVYIIEEEGTGELPVDGQIVSVHYSGFQMDGEQFDSSVNDAVFKFTLGENRVIRGWEEGIPFFKLGGKGTLLIPADLAYGATGSGVIGPGEDLRFEISIEGIE